MALNQVWGPARCQFISITLLRFQNWKTERTETECVFCCPLPTSASASTSRAQRADRVAKSYAKLKRVAWFLCLLSVSFETSSRSQVFNRAQADEKRKKQQDNKNLATCVWLLLLNEKKKNKQNNKVAEKTKSKTHLNGLINTQQQQQQHGHFLFFVVWFSSPSSSRCTKCKWLNFVVIVIICLSHWCCRCRCCCRFA